MKLENQLLENQLIEKSKKYWESYYTGADAGILIGSLWVDDLVSIQFNLTNNKSPLYGYMSEEYDAVSRGTIIVQGQFGIAFKERGYLYKILEKYRRLSSLKEFKTIDELIDYNDIAYENVSGKHRPDRWGYIDRQYENKIAGGFDIVVLFGDPGNTYRGGTVVTLNDVHLTSQSLVTEPTGDPITEIYTFFAKTINAHIPDTKSIDEVIQVSSLPSTKNKQKIEEYTSAKNSDIINHDKMFA